MQHAAAHSCTWVKISLGRIFIGHILSVELEHLKKTKKILGCIEFVQLLEINALEFF